MGRRTLIPDGRRARGFTLIEVALAAVIGSMVLIAAMGLVMTLERSQRGISLRSHESVQLQRTRLVLQRAFGSILVSAPAPASRAPSIATPVAEETGRTGEAEGGAGGPGRNGSAEASRGGAQSGASGSRRAGARDAAGKESGGSGNTRAGGAALVGAPEGAPPRVVLHMDELVSGYVMEVKETEGGVSIQSPQRLEMVLIEPPVPTMQPDAFVLAHAVRLETRRRGISRVDREADEAASEEPTDPAVLPTSGVGGGESTEASEDWGIRAVRGAFELIPKPDRKRGVNAPPAMNASGNPRAWELWWVPVAPRRTIEEVREMGTARAVLEASSYGEPYLIATDIASFRVRMFDDRVRKETFQATIANQLPAYAEVDIATVSGLSASWLFEVSWATGPETRPRTEEDPAAAGAAGAAGAEAAGVEAGGKGGAQPNNMPQFQPGGQPAKGRPGSGGKGVSR